NHLVGPASGDTIYGAPYPRDIGPLTRGRGGDDRIESGGGPGAFDYLYGDAWEIAGTGRGGHDVIENTASVGLVYGDAVDMSGRGRGGDDTLIGVEGENHLYGDAVDMSDRASGGEDRLISLSGTTNFLYGDGVRLSAHARGGDDWITAANDFVYGDAQ